MKKKMIFILTFMLFFSLVGCGKNTSKGEKTTAVTWEELLEANTLNAIFEQTNGFSSTTKDRTGDTYISHVGMLDGELIYSIGSSENTDDLRHRIVYHAPDGAIEKSITIIAPTANLNDLLESPFGEELSEYQMIDGIYLKEDQYFATLYQKDEDWGFTTEIYAYFDTETLLLNYAEMVEKIGTLKFTFRTQMNYHIGTDFPMPSYNNITNTEDTVTLTIHYPDGTTNDITVDRNVTLNTYYPNHLEQWSVCWDEACTERVDDLGWITGSHGDVYLCEGDVASAPPVLERVLKNSSFDMMFLKNYDTYFQNTYIMDENKDAVEIKDLSWYMDKTLGLCLDFEHKDAEYNILQSGKARNHAWYFWTEENGFTVDFFDDFRYVEDIIQEHRLFLYDEHLNTPPKLDEGGYAYYIPYEETEIDGIQNEYKYWIHPDFDYIERIEITRKDNTEKELGSLTCYIGGNGPILSDFDIFKEISEPEHTKTIKLTVISPLGELTYSIRRDAKISWEGNPLYRDESCTQTITDLSWVTGQKAKVYVK